MSFADADAAYCRALLKSDGCVRLAWNSGFRFPAKFGEVCAEATVVQRPSKAIGARAPAKRSRENARLAQNRKTTPSLFAARSYRSVSPLCRKRPVFVDGIIFRTLLSAFSNLVCPSHRVETRDCATFF